VTDKGRRWKLWHLAALVAGVALVLGFIKAVGLANPPSGYALGAVALLGLIEGVALVVSIRVGFRLGRRLTRGMIEWGMDHEGWIGFVVVGIGALTRAVILLVMGGFGMVTAFFLFWLLLMAATNRAG